MLTPRPDCAYAAAQRGRVQPWLTTAAKIRKNDSRTGEGPAEPVVVAIGASAGGLQALQSFFAAIPDNTGAAFVVIVHLDPKHRSELADILSTRTRMPVTQVDAREKLQPDHVYVITPDRRLQLIDHEILASPFEEPPRQRTPVDAFLRSLAEQLGDGFAVILSGAGSDGALGVRAVKEAGGIILVQDPAEAEYASMPRSAIETGPADFVLPVRELAMKLAELMRVNKAASAALPHDVNEKDLARILALLHTRTGHDFSKYKRSTVLRRIARRMHVVRTADMKKYCEFMEENAAEAHSLLSDLLISVTKFFRDAEAFDVVAKKVLPEIFAASPHGEPIRVWVPGCATGEEALFAGHAADRGSGPPGKTSTDTNFRLGPGFPRARRGAGGALPGRDRKRRQRGPAASILCAGRRSLPRAPGIA